AHVRQEPAGGGPALHPQRANFTDHGRKPVFFLQRVGAAHGDGFLAEAGVQAADDFILAEELDHGVFHRAVQAHVVVQVQILLAGQILLHALSGGGPHDETRSCTARIGCATGAATFCDTSVSRNSSSRLSSDAACMSRLKTSLKCRVKRATTSRESTLRPRSFSSDVALRPAMPQGMMRSKNRKSVETL